MGTPLAHVESGSLEYKILVLGCSQVGKSSLIRKYTAGNFPSSMMATVGIDYKSKKVKVEGVPIELKIWDTAGQERFFTFTKQFFRGTDGVMLMYDITCPSSFADIKRWIDTVQEAGLSDESMVLVGNKYDLEENRAVEISSGQHLADIHNCPFFEASAKTGHNIEKAFYELTRGILLRHGTFLPGRLPSLCQPVSRSEIIGSKSIKLDLEPQHHKKKCCIHTG